MQLIKRLPTVERDEGRAEDVSDIKDMINDDQGSHHQFTEKYFDWKVHKE